MMTTITTINGTKMELVNVTNNTATVLFKDGEDSVLVRIPIETIKKMVERVEHAYWGGCGLKEYRGVHKSVKAKIRTKHGINENGKTVWKVETHENVKADLSLEEYRFGHVFDISYEYEREQYLDDGTITRPKLYDYAISFLIKGEAEHKRFRNFLQNILDRAF